MDYYRATAGDLTDIVRVGAATTSNVDVTPLPSSPLTSSWGDFASISGDGSVVLGEDFGDPFLNLGDPLLSEGGVLPPQFNIPFIGGKEEGREETIGTPSSRGVLSRILQINTSSRSAVIPRGDVSYVNGSKLHMSTMTEDHGNRGGMKRRKCQAKKVVCIPAPAAANSRPSSGEVVPSDLWAWRKYGQKPIKGSPFPRGYYRCSSSKGCSARKQVERSRTDPNMLVITYTSEHNHPWPSQRNALAGSTRSTSKGSSGSKSSTYSSRTPKAGSVKEEGHNGSCSDDNMPSSVVAKSVKEEMDDVEEKLLDAGDAEFVGVGLAHCYRPSLMDGLDHHPDDFFAELGEIEADPYELLFKQGFPGSNDRNRGNKSVDPFNLLDLADENACQANKKGL